MRHTELPKLSLATTEHGAGSSQRPADFGRQLAHMQVKGCTPYKARETTLRATKTAGSELSDLMVQAISRCLGARPDSFVVVTAQSHSGI